MSPRPLSPGGRRAAASRRCVGLVILLPLLSLAREADFPPPRLARSLQPERILGIITNAPAGTKLGLPIVGLRPWREGRYYAFGQAVSYERGIYYCVQPHTVHTGTGWSPDKVPALWRLIRKAGEVIPEWRQPLGAHDAYHLGDIVMYQGAKYRSIINNNVWAPGVYGWEIVP